MNEGRSRMPRPSGMRSGAVTLAVVFQEAGNAADGDPQVVFVGQEDQPEVIGIGPVEARALDQQHPLLFDPCLDTIEHLLEQVPVYDLAFRPDASVIPVLHGLMADAPGAN